MNLKDAARKLIRFATTAPSGFSETVTLIANDDVRTELQVQCVTTNHNLNLTTDQYGNNVGTNAETSRIMLETVQLTEAEYPWMNANKHAAMIGHIVKAKDATGEEFTFMVKEQWPNADLGLITLMLQYYKPPTV